MPFCPSCGKEVMANEAFCWSCGTPIPTREKPTPTTGTVYPMSTGPRAKPKNAYLGLVLSFIFPGLGQYYVGQKRKGRIFVAVGVVLALAVLIEIGVFLYPLFWLYNMIDAFQTVRKVKAALPPG